MTRRTSVPSSIRGGSTAWSTTEWVLLELADGLADTPNRPLFKATREVLFAEPPATVIPLDMTLHLKAIELYAERPDKEWSLTDCVSFIAMKELALSEALTGDHHFEQAGFIALLK
jgi:predicted nucleic acid-binding protein